MDEEANVRAIAAQHWGALQAAIEMAACYPYPHNVLGTQNVGAYVLRLANHSTGKWYGLFCGEERPRAVAHMALYGNGNGRDHSCWKIRHPLAIQEAPATDYWVMLFNALVAEACSIRPGTLKIVMFLSEYERAAASAAECAGFAIEGRLTDFYRPGEQCVVFGQTVRCAQPDYPPVTSTRHG